MPRALRIAAWHLTPGADGEGRSGPALTSAVPLPRIDGVRIYTINHYASISYLSALYRLAYRAAWVAAGNPAQKFSHFGASSTTPLNL